MDLSKLIAMAAPVDVHPERCIHQFSPRATCDKCLRFCPAESISLKGGEISVATCDGCGRCVQACPYDVFEMDFPDALAMPAEAGTPLVIACRKHDFPDQPVAKSCFMPTLQPVQIAISTGSRKHRKCSWRATACNLMLKMCRSSVTQPPCKPVCSAILATSTAAANT